MPALTFREHETVHETDRPNDASRHILDLRTSEAARRVALFIPKLRAGGAEKITLNLAAALAAQGLAVDVVVGSAGGQLRSQMPEQVRLVDLLARPPAILSKTKRLAKYLAAEQPSILFSSLDIVGSAVAARLISQARTKIVMCVHTNLSAQFRDYRSVVSWMRPALLKFAYRRADHVAAVSKGILDDLLTLVELPEDRVSVLYNPVVSNEMLARASEAISHSWFDDGAHKVIVAAGRLVRQKDFPTLLKAFQVVRQHQECKLVVFGDEDPRQPAVRSSLQNLAESLGIAEHCRFEGFVQNPYAFFRRADLFVLSSIYEGLPTVLIEALACGLPVVSTDCPSGPREILCDGEFGTLVPVGDCISLARAVIKELRQPRARAPLTQRAWEFSYQSAVDRYMRLMQRLVPS
jgi:glycosyltransferase involved in cell wall biosynthesis